MEVTLNDSCLPADKQRIKFQIIEEEIYGKWRVGEYNSDEQAIHEDLPNGIPKTKIKNVYCMQADVVRWIDESEIPEQQWQFSLIGIQDTAKLLIRKHNSDMVS